MNSDTAPDVIIGDLDSISDEYKVKFNDKLIDLSHDQDSTDFQKALKYALSSEIEI